MNRAVFFDRDGVINKSFVIDGKPFPPTKLSEVEIFQGLDTAIENLKNAGFKIFLVTNQPDISRGKMKYSELKLINDFIDTQIGFDKIYCCIHDDLDACHCRKPKPGMIMDAKLEWDIDLKNSYLIGDRWKDIEAGSRAGTMTILIKSDYDEKICPPDFIFNSTLEAISFILNSQNK